MRKTIMALALTTPFLSPAFAQNQEDLSPQVLAAACAGCHGTAGLSPSAMPALAGMPAERFTAAMQAFRSGERQGTVMNRQAKGYTDDEIEAMAGYFAAQTAGGKR